MLGYSSFTGSQGHGFEVLLYMQSNPQNLSYTQLCLPFICQIMSLSTFQLYINMTGIMTECEVNGWTKRDSGLTQGGQPYSSFNAEAVSSLHPHPTPPHTHSLPVRKIAVRLRQPSQKFADNDLVRRTKGSLFLHLVVWTTSRSKKATTGLP